MMRKERVACLQWYNARLVGVLRLLMGHVIHRRMKRDHYMRLHNRLCAAALLPIAMQRMIKHWQASTNHRVVQRQHSHIMTYCRPGKSSVASLLRLHIAREEDCFIGWSRAGSAGQER